MATTSTETALNKAIHNPLLQQTISSSSSSKAPDANQVTIAMDKFENRLIKRRKFK